MSECRLISLSDVLAKRQHDCIWCGEHIAPGEQYQREKSVYCGDFQNFAWHPECREDAPAQFDDGDTEFIAHSNERPPTATTPTKE